MSYEMFRVLCPSLGACSFFSPFMFLCVCVCVCVCVCFKQGMMHDSSCVSVCMCVCVCVYDRWVMVWTLSG